jgi:uncharacterized protein with GYD domain
MRPSDPALLDLVPIGESRSGIAHEVTPLQRRFPMAEYILLTNWTEQGIKNVKESPQRLDAAKALAKKLGGELTKFYMTTGAYDMIVHVNLPADDAAAKFALTLGKAGNVRTTTLKAFNEDTYRAIIASVT